MNWKHIRNPVLALEGLSLKDACVIRRGGLYHVFSSAFDEERSRIVYVTTRDWLRFSEAALLVSGADLDAVGACSPDILFDGERYILGFNSWGQPAATPNQLFVKTSVDLVHWDPPQPLAPNLTAGRRCIDLALAKHGGLYMATWKDGAAPRFACSESLAGPWRFVTEDGLGRLTRADGVVPRQLRVTHENGEFLSIDGVWHLLLTDYNPHEPWLYRMAGDPDRVESWAEWVDGVRLDVPSQDFNSIPADAECVRQGDFRRPLHPCRDRPDRVHIVDGLSNAPFIWDERAADGCFYMLYAGKNEVGRNAFNGSAGSHDAVGGWPRGWNRLGLARSTDLRTWEAAAEA